ncbi:tRNA (guanine-N1)-methyltransferase [Bernardetia litoralis DSM 6794]|uniref:tRNA (guanine-N(1)-)-methyltransferase n=1 Tax=Bernardetia litoralis (strain ATCC 23117 / DSM 6794 / NBRC 15988 / NCIMB 1366 / Fx l1 / Sio-4) TaxID=880071 RepID=I4AK24_BERLS|nr:tRNA (guanosine(37)-N1)-methyltransferase TrmD [Bernardetia litoralis]AFM04309.1 tRNA (guanine-N1)-methyltransferase [Bernardetia litoralis DSM 6794]
MRIDIITCLPQLIESFIGHSILQRAQANNLVTLTLHDLKKYSQDKHGRIDDYAFGGGAGMVMTPVPLATCIEELLSENKYDEIIYMTPDGVTFNQSMANTYSLKENIMIICGHYKGIDERIRQKYVTKEISVGDFVVSGGEIPAALIADAIIRLVPRVMNDETSALTDSFQDDLLAPPVYTRPANWEGMEVPEILLSGHAAKIEDWRLQQAMERTKKRRPDLWKKYSE